MTQVQVVLRTKLRLRNEEPAVSAQVVMVMMIMIDERPLNFNCLMLFYYLMETYGLSWIDISMTRWELTSTSGKPKLLIS